MESAVLAIVVLILSLPAQGQFRPVATCKPAIDWGSPEILTLVAARDKIYMGYGNWSSHPGPVILTSYNPANGVVTAEATHHSDATGAIREIDGNLYLPSTDPVHHNHFEDYLVIHQSGRLESRAPFGFLHLFDIFKSRRDLLWAVGSANPNEWPHNGGVVFASPDNGRTWIDRTPANAPSRFYWGYDGFRGVVVQNNTFSRSWTSNTQSFSTASDVQRLETLGGDWVFLLRGKNPGIGPRDGALLRIAPDGSSTTLPVGGCANYTLYDNKLFHLNQDRLTVRRIQEPTGPQPTSEFVATLPEPCSSLAAHQGVLYAGSDTGNLFALSLTQEPGPARSTTFRTSFPERAGRALAVSHNTLAVGVPRFSRTDVRRRELKLQSGKVELYTRTSPENPWTPDITIELPRDEISSSGDWFGSSLALRDDYLLIGAGGRMTNLERGSGAIAYSYHRTANTWSPSSSYSIPYLQGLALTSNQLVATGEDQILRFGSLPSLASPFTLNSQSGLYSPYSVIATNPDSPVFFAVGITGDLSRGGGDGRVLVFDSGRTQTQMLTTPAGGQDRFGFSIAARNNVMAVGAPRSDLVALQAGAVCVYEKTRTYAPTETLTPPEGETEQGFGHSVALTSDQTLWIGAPNASGPMGERGAVFAYRHDGKSWNLIQKFTPGALEHSTWGFGDNIVADGEVAIIASRQTDESLPVLDRLRFLSLNDSPFQAWVRDEGLPGQIPDPSRTYPGRTTTLLEAFAFNSHKDSPFQIIATPDRILYQFQRRRNPAEFGISYQVETSLDLEEWQPLETGEELISNSEDWATLQVPIPVNAQFIRTTAVLLEE